MEENIKNTFANFSVQMSNDIVYDNYSNEEMINKWTSILLSIKNEFRKAEPKLSFKELYSETLLAVNYKSEENFLFESVPTGFTDLDRILGGLPMGEFIILGARPAMGKTAFLISVIANSIKNENFPIAYFSLGNSEQNIMLKLLTMFSELSSEKLRKRVLEDHEIVTMFDSTQILETANVTIEDKCFTIESIIAETYHLVTKKGVKLLIIDYLQLVQCKGKKYREQEVAYVCKELKALARRYNICVLVTSQLSRSVETRGGDRRPQLCDLRESGAIEQDADKVIFLHRPEYYNITEDCDGNSTRGVAEFIIAKNRQGPIDSVKLRYVGQFAKFVNADYFDEYIDPINPFTIIRTDEFNTSERIIRGSEMNDIDEDHPF